MGLDIAYFSDADSCDAGESIFAAIVTRVSVIGLLISWGTGYSCGYEIDCSVVSADSSMWSGGHVEVIDDGSMTWFCFSCGVIAFLHEDYCTVIVVVASGSAILGAWTSDTDIMVKMSLDPFCTRVVSAELVGRGSYCDWVEIASIWLRVIADGVGMRMMLVLG